MPDTLWNVAGILFRTSWETLRNSFWERENRDLQVNRKAKIEEYNTEIIEQPFLEVGIESGLVEVTVGTRTSCSGFESVWL